MKKLKLKLLMIGSIVSSISFAEYQIIYHLDKKSIILNVNSISGDSFLSNATINRGEYSTINWNYEYSDQVNIKGIGIYGESGNLNVNPLESTNYEIEITRGSNKKTKNLFLTVIQPIQNISFTADKYKVGSGQPVNLIWDVQNSEQVSIDNGLGVQPSFSGNLNVYPIVDTTYNLTAEGFSGVSADSKSLFIDVIDNSSINTFTSPTSSFINTDFSLSWIGSNVDRYELKSNSANSTVSNSGLNLGLDSNLNVNENVEGSYIYTLSAYNEINEKVESNKTVQIIPEPTLTSISINGQTNPTVSAGQALTFLGLGLGSSDVLEGRNSANTIVETFPSVAPLANGNYTYYGRSKNTVNGLTKYSNLVSTTLTVGNYYSANISSNNANAIRYGSYFIGAYKDAGDYDAPFQFGTPLNISGSNYLHYYMYGLNTETCNTMFFIYSNALLATIATGNPQLDGWFNNFTKVSLVKTDNSVFTANLDSPASYGNYIQRTATCNNTLYQQWRANPSIVKELRLHN